MLELDEGYPPSSSSPARLQTQIVAHLHSLSRTSDLDKALQEGGAALLIACRLTVTIDAASKALNAKPSMRACARACASNYAQARETYTRPYC
ncbi:unnamed protein product [Toxocara canis]|uniref:Uncharacterized protein n=1 Tax=Toxocara canis TaxID=6265 RepID=A0A183UDN8_TOXCA|nr:unnamed protein product [Toxocara canis]